MISLYDILDATHGQLFGEVQAEIFTDFCFDARRAKPSQLYVALHTARGDGFRYIDEAVDKGVFGVLCDHPPTIDMTDVTVVIVKDPEVALLEWSRFVLRKFNVGVIGVTGSAGKSVTVNAIGAVLKTKHNVHLSHDDYSGRHGLAMTVSKLTTDHRLLVAEMDITRPGEIALMVDAAKPRVGVVTSIGHAHLDAFDSLSALAEEKSFLVNMLPADGLAVLNFDDDYVRSMQSPAKITTVGMDRFGADLMAYNIVYGLDRTGFDLRYGSQRLVGRWTPLLGRQHIYSVMSALAVGMHFDVSLEEGLQALTNLDSLPGRMKSLSAPGGALVIDNTHTATPETTMASLEWLKAVTRDDNINGVFVMGDMDFLGDYSQRGHRDVGRLAAQAADVVITQGTNAAQAGRAALDHGMKQSDVRITHSHQDVINALQGDLKPSKNDVVLLTGGASSRMEVVVRALLARAGDTMELSRLPSLDEAENLTRPLRPTWVEIDLDAVAYNVMALKAKVGDDVDLMAIVKANAYGHGAVSVSKTALLNGATYLAVANMAEAIELREAGIDAPILVLSYTPEYAVWQAIRQNITLTLYDVKLAQLYERAAREVGGTLRVHVKIDTGMGRLGILPDDVAQFFRQLRNLFHIEVEGVYTHFSMADEPSDYTTKQLETFNECLLPLMGAEYKFKYIHAANSAGLLAHPDSHFNMARAGLAMYGLSPSASVPVPKDFRPALAWKTVVASVKTLPPGHPVGYGNTYTTRGEERIAVLPVGYADGFRRAPNNWGEVLIHGQRAPLVGRVSMEKVAVNVTHIPDVAIGDEVVLIGRQGDERISAEDVAKQLGTINYEVVTNALPRIPRR